MADFYIKTIVPYLSRAIKDLGTMERNDYCGVGDASNKTFSVSNFPVKSASLTAYVNGVAKSVTLYDYTYGTFTLTDAPALGARVTANYIYYSYSDGMLQDYIADAVIRLELAYYQGYVVKRDPTTDDAYLETEPNQRTQMLFIIQATIDIVEAGLASDNLVVTREWKDEDVGESYTKSAMLAKEYLTRLYKERDNFIANLKARSSTFGKRIETEFNSDEAVGRYITDLAAGSVG